MEPIYAENFCKMSILFNRRFFSLILLTSNRLTLVKLMKTLFESFLTSDMDLRFVSGGEISGLNSKDLDFVMLLSRCVTQPVDQWTGLPDNLQLPSIDETDLSGINIEQFEEDIKCLQSKSKFIWSEECYHVHVTAIIIFYFRRSS